jgi:hypothetical protein
MVGSLASKYMHCGKEWQTLAALSVEANVNFVQVIPASGRALACCDRRRRQSPGRKMDTTYCHAGTRFRGRRLRERHARRVRSPEVAPFFLRNLCLIPPFSP